jgi:steroid 5-alpha reductase family enzyme
MVYFLGTVALGIRFSNLTYRGTVTNGPYRFTKHPAYVFKCLGWWLMYMPPLYFLSPRGNFAAAINSSLLLAGVCGIYFLRARTEERHLSHYPEYVEYALAMNERSVFRCLTKVFPFLKYKAEGG